MTTNKRGIELLQDPALNKSTAFTEAEKQAARERFERHFGAVNLGQATGVGNEGIDADLARAYGDTEQW